MFQYDPGFARRLHQERVQALKQDYQPLEWKRAPRMKRGRRQLRPAWVARRGPLPDAALPVLPHPSPRRRGAESFRLAWATCFEARAVWLLVVMVPIGLVAVGIKALVG
jgi:hypothetical protein